MEKKNRIDGLVVSTKKKQQLQEFIRGFPNEHGEESYSIKKSIPRGKMDRNMKYLSPHGKAMAQFL